VFLLGRWSGKGLGEDPDPQRELRHVCLLIKRAVGLVSLQPLLEYKDRVCGDHDPLTQAPMLWGIGRHSPPHSRPLPALGLDDATARVTAKTKIPGAKEPVLGSSRGLAESGDVRVELGAVHEGTTQSNLTSSSRSIQNVSAHLTLNWTQAFGIFTARFMSGSWLSCVTTTKS
jgi:hypothetical protein